MDGDLVRSSLSEFAQPLGLRLVRDCRFIYAAKILSPLDDVVVPLARPSGVGELLGRTGVSGVIATQELAGQVPDDLGLAVSDDPMKALDALHRRLSEIPGRLWRSFETRIDEKAVVHPGALVAGRDVRLLAGAEIRPTAYVAERSVVGERSRVHAGAVVGADAYELVMIDGAQTLRPQAGGVILGADCEILSGVVVTRAAFGGATRLGNRVVLDCNVVVSHDAQIGDGVRIGGGSWIGGRARIGAGASLGPGCVVGNGLTIGDGASVTMGAVVTRDVPAGARVTGNFAVDHARFLSHLKSIR